MRTLLLIMLVACAKPAGGPLSHTFDNTQIASVPLEKKQGVTQAQQAHEQALLANTKATNTSRDSEIEQETAEYQANKAVVVSYIVASRRPEAKPATSNAQTAALARKTAEAKVTFMKARRAWLGKLASQSLYDVYAMQANLELERAKVAQANHITTADISPFEKQATDRNAAAKRAQEATAVEQKVAEGKLAEWNAAEKEYLSASGLSGPLESARFDGEWKVAAAPTTPPPAAPETPPATNAATPAAELPVQPPGN